MYTRTLICFVVSIITALPIYAQNTLEEVVVTAQRREQSLQEVPVSVTAFSGATIERANIRSARDYFALTPNVAFTDDGQSGSKGIGIAIRGIGNLVSGENATVNSVGIYLDGFSIASVPNQIANPTIPDMKSIEILRGPQGTFFGRNAVGGALNLTSADATDEFGWKLIVGGESYKSAGSMGNITAILNAPVSEAFRLRGVFQYEDSSGRVSNTCATGASAAECPNAAVNNFTPNGAKNSGYEEFYMRIKANIDAGPDTTVSLTLIYSDADQGHDENVPSGILDTDTVDTLGLSSTEDPGIGFWPDNRNLTSHDVQEYNKNKATVGILNIKHLFNDNLTLTSITGIIDAEQNRLFDQDLVGGVDTLDRTNTYKGKSWSSELRLDFGSDSMAWTLGAMYSKDDLTQDNLVAVSTNATASLNGVGWLPPFPEDLGLAFNDKTFDIEEQAVFGDVTYHATDSIDVIAGGRYTHSKVSKSVLSQGIGPTCCFPGSPGYPGGPGFDFFQSFANSPRPLSAAGESFDDFAPRFGGRFQVSEEANIYAMISKGYKPGGNSVGNNTNAPGSPAFATKYEKETLWNYELGLKSELMDNRLRLNVSIFYLDWENLQFESFFFLTPGDLSTNFEQFINIPKAEGKGFELEFTALASESLTISGGLGYLDTEITAQQTVELSGGWRPELLGLGLPKAPELTANLVGEYRWPLGKNEAWVRLEYIHRDGQYSDVEGLTNLQLNGETPNSIAGGGGQFHFSGPNEFPYLSPDYDLFNLRVGYATDNWSITGFIQNLTDEKYYTGTQENFGVNGIRLRPNPRTIGLSFSYSFGDI
jgi:iron complex outermembrane receptor protein